MRSTLLRILGLTCLVSSAYAGGHFTSDESEFLAAIQPGAYFEDFLGAPSTYESVDKSYYASDLTSDGLPTSEGRRWKLSPGSEGGYLWGENFDNGAPSDGIGGALSAGVFGDSFEINSFSEDITAIGGFFYNLDYDSNRVEAVDVDGEMVPVYLDIVVLFESGDYDIFTIRRGGFAGWIGDEKITAFQFYCNDYYSPANMYGTIDGIYTGFAATPVPEPGESALIAALGALVVVGVIRRRSQRLAQA